MIKRFKMSANILKHVIFRIFYQLFIGDEQYFCRTVKRVTDKALRSADSRHWFERCKKKQFSVSENTHV